MLPLPAELIAMILYDVHDFAFPYSVCRQLSRFCRDEIDRNILPSLLPKTSIIWSFSGKANLPYHSFQYERLITRLSADKQRAYFLPKATMNPLHSD